MHEHLYQLALTIPWQITPMALEAMLSIASGEPLPDDEIAARMHGPRSLALRNGQRREDSGRMTMRDGVAVIAIDGPIYRYADIFVRASGGITTAQLARDVQTALDDPAALALLLVADSPGGEITGIGELSDVLYAARGKKPIAGYVEGYGASATYRVLSSVDTLYADADALIGSIGTVLGVPDPSKRPRYRIDFVSRQSPKKRLDPTSDMGRSELQAMVDQLTEVFITQVARNRQIDPSAILAVEGGLLIGQQAIDAGLADRLGSEEQVIRDLIGRAAHRRAVPVTMPVRLTAQEERMKVSEFIAGIFTGAKDAGIELEADAPDPITTTTTTAATASVGQSAPPTDPDRDAQAARLAELEKQLAAQRQQQIATEAAAFADRAVREKKAFPAEHAAIVALYTQAAQDDDAHGQATLADGTLRARTALLDAEIAARPAHSLSAELIASGPGGVLENDNGLKPMTEERKRALLAMTPLGQAALRKMTRSA